MPYPDSEKHPKQPIFKSDSLYDSELPRNLDDAEKSTPTPHQSAMSYMSGPPSNGINPIHLMYQPMYHQPMTAVQAMHIQPGQPIVTNDLLIKEIRRILTQSDLGKMTKKKIRNSLSQIFQVNLDERKAFINMCIDKILQGEM